MEAGDVGAIHIHRGSKLWGGHDAGILLPRVAARENRPARSGHAANGSPRPDARSCVQALCRCETGDHASRWLSSDDDVTGNRPRIVNAE